MGEINESILPATTSITALLLETPIFLERTKLVRTPDKRKETITINIKI